MNRAARDLWHIAAEFLESKPHYVALVGTERQSKSFGGPDAERHAHIAAE